MYFSCFLAAGALLSGLVPGAAGTPGEVARPGSASALAAAVGCVAGADQFVRGPDVPHSAGYQPRGLGYLPARDWLILYSFDAEQHRSILSVIDRGSGRRVKTLAIQASAGGVAVSRHLWVTHAIGDRHYVRRFSLSKLVNARDGSSLAPDAAFPIRASRYVAIYGSGLFVGGSSRLYRYKVSPSGQLKALRGPVVETPAFTTGAIVTAEHFLFSRSTGPDESSLFTVQRRSTRVSSTFLMPSQSEGLTRAGAHVYMAFAAGTRHLKWAPLDPLIARVP